MTTQFLAMDPELARSSRFPIFTQAGSRVHMAEILVLLGAGALAAVASATLHFGLRIPGHAIVRLVLPMSAGLALAPRYAGGVVMGAGALATALAIHLGNPGALGLGAVTSLVALGPLLDLALVLTRRGWHLYLAFALAGLGANLMALAARAGEKLFGFQHFAERPLASWWPEAVASYALCGLIAGLISAGVCFQRGAGGKSKVENGGRP